MSCGCTSEIILAAKAGVRLIQNVEVSRAVASSPAESSDLRSGEKRVTCVGPLWPLSCRSSVLPAASNTCAILCNNLRKMIKSGIIWG